jgi:phosphoenolpyruvate carboxykinase (GTP)
MAMLPFAGYNFGDYWQHWLNVGSKLKNPPRIFHVNWFRRDAQGKFLWPGYGDNLRVLAWMLERSAGTAQATETAIGNLPRPEDINTKGLDINAQQLKDLLTVDATLWKKEFADVRAYLQTFGSRMPAALVRELDKAEAKL